MPLLLLLGNRTSVAPPGGGGIQPDPVPSTYSEGVTADNPLTWYRMDAPSGTTEIDRGSLAQNGTYVNGPTFGASGVDVNDAAVLFAKANSQRLVGVDHNGYSITTTGSLTVEWWALATVGADPSVAERMVSKYTPGQSEWAAERYASGEHSFRVFTLTDSFPASLIAANTFGFPSLNAWHHYVATVENSGGTCTVKTYLDGGLVDSQTFPFASITAGTTPLYVGSSAAGFPFSGTLDEVAIYSTALSATRVLAHYQAIFPPAESGGEGDSPQVPSLAAGGIALNVIRPAHPASVLGTGENPDLLVNGPEAV